MCDEYFAAAAGLEQTIREAATESGFDLQQPSIQPHDRHMLNRLREYQLVAAQLMMNDEAAIPYAAYSEAVTMILLFRSIYPAAEVNYGSFITGSLVAMSLCLREKRWNDIDYSLAFRRALNNFIDMQSRYESRLTSEHRNFVKAVRQRLQLDDENNDEFRSCMKAFIRKATTSLQDSPVFYERLESELSELGYFQFDINRHESKLITVVRSQQQGSQSVDYYILSQPALIIPVQQGMEAPTLSSLLELMNAVSRISKSNSWFAELTSNPEKLAQLLNLQIQSSELAEPLRSHVQGIVSTPNAPLFAGSADTFINHFTQNGIVLPTNWQTRIRDELTTSGVLAEQTLNVLVQALLFCREVRDLLSNTNSGTSEENMSRMVASLQISLQGDAPSTHTTGVEGEPARQEITPSAAQSMIILLSALMIRQQMVGNSQ
ncbi:hypothetical protein [Endozoicomonas euniceicola]|uniref:Uncharacterized protein n=1 Tax=Endozoicomonas euniceicola TaxID=1234143 RepID=A0ABY6GQJ7_9GAMM|nr:hypothetical protein [Endozoicomonas euniceicola]UYM15012.1 hypothetical protein NX720_19380 [Endozoicomonas euniceicola]